MVINRGSHEEIDVFPGFPLENKLSGNVVDLCPVGALGDKDFLYQPAGLVHESARRRLHRLFDRLLDHGRREPGSRSIGLSRARIHTSTNGGCATTAVTAVTTYTTSGGWSACRRREGSAYVNLEWQDAGRPSCRRSCRPPDGWPR